MRLVTLFSWVASIGASFVQGDKGEDVVSALVLKPENVNIASQSTGQDGTFVHDWVDSKTYVLKVPRLDFSTTHIH
jgi:hypothetical protein